jgi:hypothetical protein
MRKMMTALALIAAALLLASCGPPESENPLSDPASAARDDALLGVWTFQTEDGATGYAHIVAAPEGRTDLVFVFHDAKKGADVSAFTFFTTAAGGRTYMNAQERARDKPGPKPDSGYVFARYEIAKDGALALALMDEGEAAKAVEAGRVKGTVTRGEAGSLVKVRLTDSSAGLEKFAREADAATLWKPFLTLRRVLAPAR